MIKIRKIVWDFSDTEFEDCDYEEARKIAVLPKSLKINEDDLDSDAEEEDIIFYLEENYNFSVKEIKTDLDD
jgi:hypothetical protein|tara:strand:+ start:1048 stop:1263 length:216 start_codon:yes stop_codon:yes gene_type:complete